MPIEIVWRGPFETEEVNGLHAAAFETRVYTDEEWAWGTLVARHSLGWVTARDAAGLVGFANVAWDGLVHAWLQDVMVDERARRRGVGRRVVAACADDGRAAGCEILHVDFDDDLTEFYIDSCGFTPSSAGLLHLA